MESVVEKCIARGSFVSRGVVHVIRDARAFRSENAPVLHRNICYLRKRGTYEPLRDFIQRHNLADELNMTMFSAFCACEKFRLDMAIRILEARLRDGESIHNKLACLIKLTRAIEHNFLKGRDKMTYLLQTRNPSFPHYQQACPCSA